MKLKFVKHVKGTGKRNCSKCNSWISHWRHITGIEGRIACSRYGCKKTGTDGGHVMTARTPSRKQMIIPLCKEHNPPSNKRFRIKKTVPAPARKCRTKNR